MISKLIMVYFRITLKIKKAIDQAVASGFLGCGKYCDKQLISIKDLEELIDILSKKGNEKVTIQDLIEDQTPLMIPEHVCNNNLKNSEKVAEDIIKEKPKNYKMSTMPDEEFKVEKEKWDNALKRCKKLKEKREYKRLMKGASSNHLHNSFRIQRFIR